MTGHKVTFGRSESFYSGWMGKQAHIEIRVDGVPVGEIYGRQATSVAGVMMMYEVKWSDDSLRGVAKGLYVDNLANAKEEIRAALAKHYGAA